MIFARLVPPLALSLFALAGMASAAPVTLELGAETGVAVRPAVLRGYNFGNWMQVAEFTEAAMALVKVGDVSEPFKTSYGIHIVKYVSDVTEGAVPLDTVKDTLSAELLTQKQDDLYNTTVEQWVTEANAKTYLDRMAD